MSEKMFTPGPWKVSEVGAGFEIDNSDGYTVAQAQQVHPHNKANTHLRERRANAHLIAASPDLYDEVEKHYKSVVCVCKLNSIVAPFGAGIECTKCALASLLAKALGKDSL